MLFSTGAAPFFFPSPGHGPLFPPRPHPAFPTTRERAVPWSRAHPCVRWLISEASASGVVSSACSEGILIHPACPPGRSTPTPRRVSTGDVLSSCQLGGGVALKRTGGSHALGLPGRGDDALRGWRRRHWGVSAGGGDVRKCPHRRHRVRGPCPLAGTVTVPGDGSSRRMRANVVLLAERPHAQPPGHSLRRAGGVLPGDVPQGQVNKPQLQSLRRPSALGRGWGGGAGTPGGLPRLGAGLPRGAPGNHHSPCVFSSFPQRGAAEGRFAPRRVS